MRAPPAAARRPRKHLWWRWRWLAMAGGSGSRKRKARRMRKPRPDPTALLTDDLLVEILARVLYRDLCRFRCVSKRWSALISDPDNRRRLPQTLTGIFYPMPLDPDDAGSQALTPHGYGFTNVSGTGPPFIHPSFSFLPDRERVGLELVDCCNGLILCRCFRFADDHEFHYLVLNPATEEWVAVPVTRRWSTKLQTVRLGFDPAVSPHFYVFEFELNEDYDEDYNDDDWDGHVVRVKIYSSGTGFWIDKENGWTLCMLLPMDFKSVFLDGVLYVIAIQGIIGVVDVEGRTWRIIEFPDPRSEIFPFNRTDVGFIDLFQGQLHFATDGRIGHSIHSLEIWVLEDKESEEWTLKHTVCFEFLLGRKREFGFRDFIVVAIHSDRNMVFFVCGRERTLMSYDMDRWEGHIICNLGYSEIEHFLPYVPLLPKSLPDCGNQ
ncbi:unnamed protein product [Urochloa decumbens]|uniref:F-box domain-containing protein n=1 Tax=Urochloa decumbens TaxID=240449 RepID=A0ABC8W144_9POAL